MKVTGRIVLLSWIGWIALLVALGDLQLRRLSEATGGGVFVLLPWRPWRAMLWVLLAFSPVLALTAWWAVQRVRSRGAGAARAGADEGR